MIELFRGDCLIESEKIKNGSVDLILTDPPYGNMDTDGGRKLGIKDWDVALKPYDLFKIADLKLRKNGRLILFSQEPYTSLLITSTPSNLQFNYRAVWEKDNFAVALGVNKNMVSFTEDILIFSKRDCFLKSPSKEYTDRVREFINLPNSKIYEDFETNGFKKYAVLDTFNSNKARRYNFPSETTYKALIHLYNIDKMQGFRAYADLKAEYIESTPGTTFNLWQGGNYKSNILKYKKDYEGFHPTQKPIKLLEDIIKTFSNQNDLVVDLTMGSGSTGVAAANTGRRFKGIEKDANFFKTAQKRIQAADLKELY